MKQSEIKKALCNIEIDKIIIGSHMEQLPEHIIELILYFTYSYTFKNREELRTAVRGYPDNMKHYGNISLWNVSKVTDMSCMFSCSLFNGDISQWNVSNVTNMDYMFFKSQFNDDISKWAMKP